MLFFEIHNMFHITFISHKENTQKKERTIYIKKNEENFMKYLNIFWEENVGKQYNGIKQTEENNTSGIKIK